MTTDTTGISEIGLFSVHFSSTYSSHLPSMESSTDSFSSVHLITSTVRSYSNGGVCASTILCAASATLHRRGAYSRDWGSFPPTFTPHSCSSSCNIHIETLCVLTTHLLKTNTYTTACSYLSLPTCMDIHLQHDGLNILCTGKYLDMCIWPKSQKVSLAKFCIQSRAYDSAILFVNLFHGML